MSAPVEIEIRGLRTMARVGVSDEELELERAVIVDIELRTPDNLATATDSITDTIDYAEVAAEAERLATSEPHRTLERLANRIVCRLAEVAGEGIGITVRVSKPAPPMPQNVDHVAVTVTKEPTPSSDAS
ncbi:MAG: dihydroneopterin aldolase [Solirubrobacterales bacterium]